MTEEQIIEIIKLEAHKNLTIVDEGTDSYNDYVIRGVDLMAKSLVKLFTIPAVVGRSEQLPCDCNVKLAETTLQIYCPKCYKTHKMK